MAKPGVSNVVEMRPASAVSESYVYARRKEVARKLCELINTVGDALDKADLIVERQVDRRDGATTVHGFFHSRHGILYLAGDVTGSWDAVATVGADILNPDQFATARSRGARPGQEDAVQTSLFPLEHTLYDPTILMAKIACRAPVFESAMQHVAEG